MKKFFTMAIISLLAVSGTLSLCSCWSVFNDFVEYDANQALQNTTTVKGSHPSDKAQKKEAERLKKEGKCPLCHGLGKTPDGRYTCTACNGTGKYQEEKE